VRFSSKKPSFTEPDLIRPGERVLAWVPHKSGKLVVTNLAIIDSNELETFRLPWEFALSAKWNEPTLTLISNLQEPTETFSTLISTTNTKVWQLEMPGLVPAAVRERITSTQIFDQVQTIAGVGKVRFLARMSPSGVHWATLTEDEISSDSQTAIAAQLSELRSTLGI